MKKHLRFAHIGDLHITKAKEQNYIDLLSIIAQIETNCSQLLDFVFLPGDNADNGLPEQYKLVETALKMLSIPVFIIPGDHDMEQGSLENFYNMKFTQPLPKAVEINGYHCLFLDVSGRGKGGPDFRVLDEQLNWLESEMKIARHNQADIVLFMHTYPSDLKDEAEIIRLNQLIADYGVLLVDMGHTHYNELANDGTTIFSATRSTGQIEEGPVGYSIACISDRVVSWRFKALHDPFPLVCITSPADYRLTTNFVSGTEIPEIEASIFGATPINEVFCVIDDQKYTMTRSAEPGFWTCEHERNVVEPQTIYVEAIDTTGRPSIQTITLSGKKNKTNFVKNGSDEDAVDAWPENGIFGTQLGPNRNGKPS